MKKISLFIGVLICFYASVTLQAQNPASINVNNLSDQQIQQIVTQVNARGLTIDQAAQMAQMQGATPVQIEQLKRRIQELNFSKVDSTTNQTTKKSQKIKLKKEVYSEKAIVETTPENKRIFGFQFFNSDKLTFEPPVNMPTPQNYVLGIDDELTVSIWGASQQTYQLPINTNGAINIPDIGQIYVSGMEFAKAKELIKKRLISIYQGMDEQNPNTYGDVSISNLRSIKVNVIGEAMAPGTYTLPSTASAFNALYLSGGPNENGSFRNIQLIRDNKIVKTIDVYDYMINANMDGNIQLREQDIIYIPTYQKRVEAAGAFKRTGIFELSEKEKLSDLIRYLGGFTDQAFKAQLSLTRITDTEKKVIDINQSIYESFVPNNGDSIVASEVIKRFENRINISGAVFRPGTYELTEGLTLSGLIKKAQGVTENYFSSRGLIVRLQNNLAPMTLSFNVDDILKGTNDIKLQREDQVIIQDIFSMREKRTIQILGEVQNPGVYPFSDNMTLKDMIFKAGGFTEAASESFIELARRHNYAESNLMSDELVKLYQFNIDRKLNLDAKGDTLHLQPFDYIYVRKAPSYHQQRTVFITGEVRFPGAYSIGSKKERISDLIKRSGGLTPDAFIKGARMKRSNPDSIQKAEILRNNLPDSLITKAEKQISSDKLELRLDDIMKKPGSAFDYMLKDGDQIIIPEVSQEVRISGEVQNPIGLAYQSGKSLKYFINRSGGFSDNAKKSKTFVIYSDGTTQVTRVFLGHNYPTVEPGCQIIVPQKPEKQRIDNTGKWLGIASTMATVAIAIATLVK
ncbi:polysialic acid transport protein [Aquipluma nitroreducens]|uniref:Polysialic acid transport protein n=1 Tax=Aquipluma nitroreducens TaxID=2010828 RepID=A0A5K7SBM7_9BACT|nr:SLBB domain-containing protein [Aquipluma nitroreducens]BBE18895.1 polysialic acid transport protein [Aquipluma nitroreducens]